MASKLRLRMSNFFVQSDSSTVRWAQDSKVAVSGDSEVSYTPDKLTQQSICDDRSKCGVGECVDYGDRYRCRCPPGFREVQNPEYDCEETEVSPTETIEVTIDPCEINPCGPGTCVSRTTTFYCLCPAGYDAQNQNGYGSCVLQYNENSDACVDHDCGAGSCIDNGNGEYQCNCPSGFRETLNRHRRPTCKDYRNEGRIPSVQKPCEVKGICGDIGTCVPDGDSEYHCECPQGFTEVTDQYTTRCEASGIHEFKDACSIPDICGPGHCVPDGNSYSCRCDQGYYEKVQGSRRTCEDVDECAGDDNICSRFAYCLNFDGAYQCQCEQGYSGDGRNCYKDEDAGEAHLTICQSKQENNEINKDEVGGGVR